MGKAMILPKMEVLKDGYKLLEAYQSDTPIKGYTLESPHSLLTPDGQLLLKIGFKWDGPSGPAVDTPATLMPSANHDCLCGLWEQKRLAKEAKALIDDNYRGDLKNWGVSLWRRSLHFRGVRLFGGLWARFA